jgi:hypothetical protein
MVRSRGILARAALVAIAALCIAAPGARAQDDGTAVEEILNVLRERGLIDEATEAEILAKQERADAKAAVAAASAKPVSAAPSWLDGFVWSGDLRLRNEQFWYGRAFGGTNDDNNRFRYRARLGFTKQFNSWVTGGVRLASSQNRDYRSTNVTFGNTSNFSPDEIYIDQAYLRFALPDPGSVGLATSLTAGKMANPFIWKNSLDKLVWDEDISPEGIALTSTLSPAEGAKLFATAAYFVEAQQSSDADARVFGFQTGGSLKAGVVEGGARASYYAWDHVDNDANFFTGSDATGNLPTGLDDDMGIGETTVYLSWAGIEGWPTLFWGTYTRNFSANDGFVDGVDVDDEGDAFGFGVELGDAKVVRIGVAYNHVEANGVLGLYTDSDMFDGFTNREGFAVYASHAFTPWSELKLSLWEGEPIKTTNSGNGDGPYNISESADQGANRKRLQADVNFKF